MPYKDSEARREYNRRKMAERRAKMTAEERQAELEENRRWYKDNREKVNRRVAEYCASHRDEVNAKKRAYRDANKEEVNKARKDKRNAMPPLMRELHRLKCRQWNEKNRDKQLAKMRERYANDPSVKERQKEYKRTNADRMKELKRASYRRTKPAHVRNREDMKIPDRVCGVCQKTFAPRNRKMVYCSLECGGVARQTIKVRDCRNCGKQFRPYYNSGAGLYCSFRCRGDAVRDGKPIHGSAECPWCERSFPLTTKGKMYCSFLCALRFNSFRRTMAKARTAAESKQPITLRQWRELCEQFGYRCAYCLKRCDKLSLDHIEPVSKGGADDIDNIVPACKSCNSAKGNRPMIFLGLRRRRAGKQDPRPASTRQRYKKSQPTVAM